MRCPCILTAAFMERMGAPISARQHRERGRASTPQEDIAHMDEEDRTIGPLFSIFDPVYHRKWSQEHRRFRWEIATYGEIVSRALWAQHAIEEDDAILRMMRAQGEA